MIQDSKLKLKLKFLKYFKDLPVQKLAGGYIGKDEDTIIRWKHEDEDFADQIENARSTWAMKKTKKVKSPEWLLERTLKDHFAQKTEVENSGELTIKVVSYDPKPTDPV